MRKVVNVKVPSTANCMLTNQYKIFLFVELTKMYSIKNLFIVKKFMLAKELLTFHYGTKFFIMNKAINVY